MVRIPLEFGRSSEIFRKTLGRPQLQYDAFFDLRTYGGKFKKRYIARSIFFGLGAGQKSSDMHDTISKYKRKKERNEKSDEFWDAQTIRAFFLQYFNEPWVRIGQDLLYVGA